MCYHCKCFCFLFFLILNISNVSFVIIQNCRSYSRRFCVHYLSLKRLALLLTSVLMINTIGKMLRQQSEGTPRATVIASVTATLTRLFSISQRTISVVIVLRLNQPICRFTDSEILPVLLISFRLQGLCIILM